jgi:GNAT superfamily N-acetyltransferase
MIRIRTAHERDAAALTAIAFAAKRHWGYPEPWIQAWAVQLTQTPERLRACPTWVATDAGDGDKDAERPIGFVALLDDAGEWSLEHLWLDPAHHGRGIGRRLLETALDYVARTRPGRVRIESDPNAEAFYVHCGARRVGAVPAPVLGTARELPLLVFEVRAP